MASGEKYAWLWDLDMDRATFQEVLNGKREEKGLNWKWALIRLIEYAPYADILRLLPRELFLQH